MHYTERVSDMKSVQENLHINSSIAICGYIVTVAVAIILVCHLPF